MLPEKKPNGNLLSEEFQTLQVVTMTPKTCLVWEEERNLHGC